MPRTWVRLGAERMFGVSGLGVQKGLGRFKVLGVLGFRWIQECFGLGGSSKVYHEVLGTSCFFW